MAQLALIQARASSRRLPGKVLREAAGKPMLVYLVERLQHCQAVDRIAVATSQETDDDAVAALCGRLGIRVLRGPLDDVMTRFLTAARELHAASFVRVNGDSPLLDGALVTRGVQEFEAGGFDLVSNVFPRSFPKGQSVEVVSVAALENVARETRAASDREHVTSFFYAHPERFRIRNFANNRDLGGLQMSVDTPEDFAAFERAVSHMTRPHWNYGFNELVALAQE